MHEERSPAGITLAIIIGLVLCLLLATGGGSGAVYVMRDRAHAARLKEERARELAMAEQQLQLYEHHLQMQTAAAAKAGKPTKEISIGIDVLGGYTLDGEAFSGEELQQYLANQAASNPQGVKVLIRPADETAYVLVAATTTLCERAGAKDVTLVKAEAQDE
jgi:biopolymer transport protein ExbD